LSFRDANSCAAGLRSAIIALLAGIVEVWWRGGALVASRQEADAADLPINLRARQPM
jgi:hypothetical protein